MDQIKNSNQNGELIESKKEVRTSRQRRLDQKEAIMQQRHQKEAIRQQLINEQNNQNN